MSRNANIVEQIKEKADIVETVGRIVPLRRSGKSWSGLCPFHTETDGSFHVYEDSGNFICFGCGVKGDVITFYERYYNLPFIDACERLAQEYGIEWLYSGSFSADKGKDALYEVNRFAGSIYYEAIKAEGNPALAYMIGRGIDRKTIAKFRIGYADDSGHMLARRLDADVTMQKSAEDVGLIHKYGDRYRDRFEERVMFPIVNTRGKVIGFGGRDISGNAKAKYINSAGSDIYSKGSNLYGLNVTQHSIREQGFVILVEGYMDLVALYMHGITNVCAQLGTAFTPQQAKLLGRYAKSVTLALDSDESGQNAAMKSMEVLAEAGLKVSVILLEGAKDPDEFVRTFGREAFDKALQNATPMYDYKLDRMKGSFDLSVSDGLTDFLKAAANLIAGLSPVEQDYYIKKLSQETGIAENAIAMQTQGSGKDLHLNRMRREKLVKTDAPKDDLFCRIIGLALSSGYAFERAVACRHFFDKTDYCDVMNAMLALKDKNGVVPTVEELSEALDEADQAVLDFVVTKAAERFGDSEEELIDEYVAKLELASLRAEEDGLKESVEYADGDIALLNLKDLIRIQNRIKLLEGGIRSGKPGEEKEVNGIGN